VLAVIVAVHGIAHGAGVLGNLVLVENGGSAELLGGWWVTGDPVALTVAAAVWGALAAVMLLASSLLMAGSPAARQVLVVAASASLLVCAISLFAAEVGVAVNVGLLLAAHSMDRTAPDPRSAGRPAR
jgi:hypothetical protein